MKNLEAQKLIGPKGFTQHSTQMMHLKCDGERYYLVNGWGDYASTYGPESHWKMFNSCGNPYAGILGGTSSDMLSKFSAFPWRILKNTLLMKTPNTEIGEVDNMTIKLVDNTKKPTPIKFGRLPSGQFFVWEGILCKNTPQGPLTISNDIVGAHRVRLAHNDDVVHVIIEAVHYRQVQHGDVEFIESE